MLRERPPVTGMVSNRVLPLAKWHVCGRLNDVCAAPDRLLKVPIDVHDRRAEAAGRFV
jgi:hypothetical protein